MKKFFKILLYIFGGVAIVVAAYLFYFNSAYPKVDPPSNEKVEITPARLKRGAYLVKHVTVCLDCHSTRDWSKLYGPVIPNTLGKGGEEYNEQNAGVPGKLYAKNITPAGIGSWTDGELIRAITCGVNKNNVSLFPLMPYVHYNNLSREDLYSIVAYIRSLPAIQNTINERSLDFPLNFIVKTIPLKSYMPAPEPNKNNPVEYGKYLVNAAACFDCHTQMVKGKPIMEKAFAGGFPFQLAGGTVRSSNITPDPVSGIGSWTKEQFITRFKSTNVESNQFVSVGQKDFNSVMPWTLYGGMKQEDLSAIYDYLRTITPVKNAIVKFTLK